MCRLNIEKVWSAFKSERGFLEEFSPEAQNVLRRFVERCPELLADHLDQPVSVASIVTTRLMLAREALQGGAIVQMAHALRDADGDTFDEEERLEMLQDLTEEIDELEVQTVEVLKQPPLDNAALAARFELNGDCRQLLEEGGLTIGILLETQPLALFADL